MRIRWKLVGLAGAASIAANGVAVARKRRAHEDLTPEQLRERLRRRLAEVPSVDAQAGPPPADRSA
jgi:hypothetical protein